MKRLAFLIVTLCSITLYGQFPAGYNWKLPKASMPANVSQMVGVTEITIEYHRPAVKSRNVWEEERIAPYGKVWRAGANEATQISFSTPVSVNGLSLEAGTYAFFVIPNEDSRWEVIFNSQADQWGAFGYQVDKDVLRTGVVVSEGEFRERLEYSFPEVTDSTTVISLRWANKDIRVPIAIDTRLESKKLTNKTFDWSAAYFAANYFFMEGEYKESLRWIEASVALSKSFTNLIFYTDILEKLEHFDDAVKVGEEVIAVLEANPFNGSDEALSSVKRSIKHWKKNLPSPEEKQMRGRY